MLYRRSYAGSAVVRCRTSVTLFKTDALTEQNALCDCMHRTSQEQECMHGPEPIFLYMQMLLILSLMLCIKKSMTFEAVSHAKYQEFP